MAFSIVHLNYSRRLWATAAILQCFYCNELTVCCTAITSLLHSACVYWLLHRTTYWHWAQTWHLLLQGQGRIEKTEIIEMAIKHIKQLQARLDGKYTRSFPPYMYSLVTCVYDGAWYTCTLYIACLIQIHDNNCLCYYAGVLFTCLSPRPLLILYNHTIPHCL